MGKGYNARGHGENMGGPEAQRLGGSVDQREARGLGGPERGAWAGKPEGAGFEPAKLFRSLPI